MFSCRFPSAAHPAACVLLLTCAPSPDPTGAVLTFLLYTGGVLFQGRKTFLYPYFPVFYYFSRFEGEIVLFVSLFFVPFSRKRKTGCAVLILCFGLERPRKNQSAAPASPPCFRRWRRSAPLQKSFSLRPSPARWAGEFVGLTEGGGTSLRAPARWGCARVAVGRFLESPSPARLSIKCNTLIEDLSGSSPNRLFPFQFLMEIRRGV